jgi:hypothetical protein
VLNLDATVRFWTDLIGHELLMSEPGYARVGGGDGLELGLEERPPRIHRRIGHRASRS